ncbi:hypothetical protein Egran_00420 [Elaphomyces granulatus]|uniref:Uncharacterized protein n=1 Tax=Elaphomyces granulatus TaxID=519963 RepID=A0A232M6A2_9EURO|nr:hypothetical protein Egran_00420 [Elaphomyces granulatus]
MATTRSSSCCWTMSPTSTQKAHTTSTRSR